MPKRLAHEIRRRPPYFRPVPVRGQNGGWSVGRQCAFLAKLYVRGSVAAAARAVGMSRAGAYRLRQMEGAAHFAWAWDTVLAVPGSGPLPLPQTDWRKVTHAQLSQQVEAGFVQPVVYRGEMVAIRRKPDNSGLLRLLGRSAARMELIRQCQQKGEA